MIGSIINTSGNTKIFSTNNVNKIEVSTENIIESDSELREVIKKGYLLNNINLSTIPDIIQDAINAAILDAKNKTLADALIENLRNSIESLNDGIYKKTFINNTISYLEELIIQKASPEIVAAIAEAKIAVATENFATASEVELITSKVASSEAEIIKVKETINTNEVSRARELTNMEARINDTFAGYSEAIELYVDTDGNVKSEKIETLSTNIGLQIQEVNQLIVNTDNNWNAKSIKLITSPNGGITGYSFQDGSGLKSTFDINADNFKISNSYNTYSPFSIVGTSLYFNGKISFTNTTNVPDFVLTAALNTQLEEVNTNISTAQSSANSANALLADIANDNKLTPDEKINTKKEWEIIISEKNKNVAQANNYGVNVVAYNSAYNTLNTYLTELLTNLTTTSDIIGSVFRSIFKLYYDARTDLLNAIANKIKTDLTNAIDNLTKVESISWQQEVQNAINNNATYVDGSKVVTNQALVNNLNATGGIIAETVTANEFVGKTFTGAVINGAVINGAVVKASYLDLDGELEVLTNYHITVAMYNANPSLYTDAVYLSGTDEYRIPSLSTIREETKTQNISINGAIFNSKIRSYNCANAGHNLKCVKNITSFTSSSSIKILTISNPTQSASDPYTFSSNKVRIYIGGINIGLDVQYVYHHIPSNYDAEGIGSPEVTEYYWLLNGSKINSITVNGFSFTTVGNELYLSAGTYNLLSNFTDTTSSLIKLENIGGWNVAWYGIEYTSAYATYYSAAQSINIAHMNTNLTINNMI